MLVKDLMNKNVITIDTDASIRDAILVMSDNDVGCVIVTKNDRVVGILTERDIIRCLAKPAGYIDIDRNRVESVMTRYVISVTPNTKIEKAIQLMKTNKIKKLPVLNDSSKLLGIITESDICMAEPKIIERISELLSKNLKEI